MKKLFEFFSRKPIPALEHYSGMEMKKEEADSLFGGFKEYTPPIYEQDIARDDVFKTKDLLTDINQSK